MDQDLYLYPTTLEGRFVNHSCNPNAGLRDNRHMIALRPIEAGEEIRFDYSTCMSERLWTMHCRCGESNCRTVIRDFHDLPDETRRRYIALGIVQRFIIEEISHLADRRKLIRAATSDPGDAQTNETAKAVSVRRLPTTTTR
jgi:hypothetical protein